MNDEQEKGDKPITLSMYEIPTKGSERVAAWPENISVYMRKSNDAQFVTGGVFMQDTVTRIAYPVDMEFNEARAQVEAARSLNAYTAQMLTAEKEGGDGIA